MFHEEDVISTTGLILLGLQKMQSMCHTRAVVTTWHCKIGPQQHLRKGMIHTSNYTASSSTCLPWLLPLEVRSSRCLGTKTTGVTCSTLKTLGCVYVFVFSLVCLCGRVPLCSNSLALCPNCWCLSTQSHVYACPFDGPTTAPAQRSGSHI